MKKFTLVFLVAISLSGVVIGQQNLPIRDQVAIARAQYNLFQDGVPVAKQPIISHTLPAGTGGLRSLTETKFASSHNGFSLLIGEANSLEYKNNLNLLSFAHRACESFLDMGGNSGWVQLSFSKDRGATWDTTKGLIMTQTDPLINCRYPAGGVVNPSGNTNPDQAYGVVAGPVTDNSLPWAGYYFGSTRLDSTNNNQQTYNIYTDFYEQMPRYSFATFEDKAFVLGLDYDINSTGGWYGGSVINRGVFNTSTNSMDWTQNHIHIPFALDNTGAQELYNLGGNLAFNDDGSVGYFVIVGVDSLNPVGYYPMLYRSTDQGATWTKDPFFDYRDMPEWSNYLIPTATSGNTPKPFWTTSDGIDAVIDNQNRLHILCSIYSAFSDNTDSLNFIYTTRPQIFDVYQDGEGGWKAEFVDTLASDNGVSELWTSTSGAVYVDARIQAATSTDRSKIMALWLDTDPSYAQINDYSNIKGWALNLSDETTSGVMNFTSSTDYAAYNAWLYVSDKAWDDGNGLYSVGATVSKSRDQSYSMDFPMDHYFVGGLDFLLNVGINNVTPTDFSVEQNFPNPFSGNTQFSLTMKKAGSANVKVTNVLGETLLDKNYTLGSGKHYINVNGKNFSSGVYYYTVTVGDSKVSNKMVVQ